MKEFFRIHWRGLLLLWATWFYFLIFAQFGFLHRVESLYHTKEIESLLGAMAIAGFVGALLCGYCFRSEQLRVWVTLPLFGSAVSAILAGVQSSYAGNLLAAIMTGLSLGVLTVSVVGFLSSQHPRSQIGLVVGVGTGLAYWTCNWPVIFNALPKQQCWMAAAASLLVAWIPMRMDFPEVAPEFDRSLLQASGGRFNLWGIIAFFLALVWTDSAAFAQIQSLESLKQLSWGADAQLHAVGFAHLFVAVLAGDGMDHGKSRKLYLLAFAALLLGYALITRSVWALPGTLIYAGGVSIYSTGLVAFALVTYSEQRPVRRAGWVFAIAGWLGSAMGIGMIQDLGQLPFAFWCVATLAVAFAFLRIEPKALS